MIEMQRDDVIDLIDRTLPRIHCSEDPFDKCWYDENEKVVIRVAYQEDLIPVEQQSIRKDPFMAINKRWVYYVDPKFFNLEVK